MDTETVPWRGVHHLALVTPNMDETVRFYVGVLGMPLVSTMLAGPMRHYFFQIAPQMTVAFFEIEGAETWAKPAGAPLDRPAQFDHLSFGLGTEAEVLALRDRLLVAGCGVTEMVDHGVMRSIYFSDNNGIALEASWWVVDLADSEAGDARGFTDPDPVPAIAELANGALLHTPRTVLA